MMRQVAYICACIAAATAALVLLEGMWLAVALTVIAFFAGGIFEVLIDFRYEKYREEWELANGADLDDRASGR